MIRAFYKENIIKCLAAVFTYGLNNCMSPKSIEEHITSSTFINDLENNEFDIDLSPERCVTEVYKCQHNPKVDISFKGLFLSESYLNLFFFFNRSFEYLFLYWPLSLFVEKYQIYHEMDFSNIKSDFIKEVDKTPLLKKLSTDRGIKISEISRLTGISVNTLETYCRGDKYIYAAANDTIFKLSKLFGVKENIFISNLAVYLDRSIYLFDKSNQDYRNYLAFFFANYYDLRINEKEFVYKPNENCFMDKRSGLKIIIVSHENDELSVSQLKDLADEKTYLIVFDFGHYYHSLEDYAYLKEINCVEVMLITQEDVFIIKKWVAREITDTINRSLIIRAKIASGAK